MANRDLDTLPERSVVIVRAFGGPLNRAVKVGGVVTVVVALGLVTAGVGDRVHELISPIVIGAVSALIGVAVGIATLPATTRRAFEAHSWLGSAEIRRFRERTGGPVPTKRAAMLDWLATTPSTPTMRLPRIELLAFVGQFDEARAELQRATANDQAVDPALAFELATLRQYVEWLEHGSTDLTALRESAGRLSTGSRARLESQVTLAIAAARPLAQRREPGWSEPLEAVRTTLGRGPWRATLSDMWRPTWFLYFVLGLASSMLALVLRSVL